MMNATDTLNATVKLSDAVKKATDFPKLVNDMLPATIEMASDILSALLVLVIGLWVAKRISALVIKGLSYKGRVDVLLSKFLGNLVYYVLLAGVFMAALNELGVRTTSFLAIFGTAGLAIGLALKNYLSNFAAGVMLLLFRPFRVGHKVNAGGVTGKVQDINVFETHLITPENQKLIVPNSKIIGATINNYSAMNRVRFEIMLAFPADLELAVLKELLLDAAQNNAKCLKDPAPKVLVKDISGGKTTLDLQIWTKTDQASDAKSEILETIKLACAEENISIA